MDETCSRLESQFETIVQSGIHSASREMQQVCQEAVNLTLNDLHMTAQHVECEAHARFQADCEPVAATGVLDLKNHVEEISRTFSDGLADYGRSYLELVGDSVTDLAKSLGKGSKE
jgi:hypothetical protein